MAKQLNLIKLKAAASDFAREMSGKDIPELFGITDGKAVGTFVEHAFHNRLKGCFDYEVGSSASGIDFPTLGLDMKVTSVRQPQSSCPFRAAEQKIYGLGYHLLVFVYEKHDDNSTKVSRLNFLHVIFVEKNHTADYLTTKRILEILDRNGNKDDLVAFLEERNLPLDEIGRDNLAERILRERPEQGYLTVSNALQWRLQYGRIVSITASGGVEGVENLLKKP